jgi:DNA polymerase eta
MAKSYLTLREKYDRIIVLIDMDAFYTQVEENLDSKLKGKPIAVCQYQENSGIIAVNYPARALGITRHMRERDVKAANKDVVIIKVASKNGKADISKYREAGAKVAKVFQKFTNLIERASIDEGM